MTTWPIQQAVVERLYGLPCVSGANEEKLAIPFAGPFDLVIAPHVLVHAVEPHQFFDEVRRVLAPAGYLYLCQEPDDVRLFNRGKNLFSELKCFHFQQIDSTAYLRALQYNGFETAHVGYRAPTNARKSLMWALGRRKAARPPEQLGKAELTARKTMYRRWRDESIIALPAHLRTLFADEWSAIAQRAVEGGYAQKVDGELRTNRDIYRTYDRSH
jgi:SAM-dependent methyltransferase